MESRIKSHSFLVTSENWQACHNPRTIPGGTTPTLTLILTVPLIPPPLMAAQGDTRLEADVVFLSPPWGPKYKVGEAFDPDEHLVPSGAAIFETSISQPCFKESTAPRLIYYLPINTVREPLHGWSRESGLSLLYERCQLHSDGSMRPVKSEHLVLTFFKHRKSHPRV